MLNKRVLHAIAIDISISSILLFNPLFIKSNSIVERKLGSERGREGFGKEVFVWERGICSRERRVRGKEVFNRNK
jgi:hypothetical protein